MANLWFRMYSEFADDPKVQMMPEAMQRRFVMLLCARCKELSLTDDQLAFAWRITIEEARETKLVFITQGFIDEQWNLLKWDDRQFLSDSSLERVRRYRDKRESAGLKRGSAHLADKTLYERDGNRCIYCLSPLHLCIDHIYPICMGGDDSYDNLGVACKSCNSGKAGRTPEMARYAVQNKDAYGRYERYIKARDLPVTVTVTVQEQIQNRTEQRKQKHSAKDKPSPDPRAAEFKADFEKAFAFVNNQQAPWDAKEATNLKRWLAKNPTITRIDWQNILQNRRRSPGINQAADLSRWISLALAWRDGPADEWGKPIKPNGGMNGAGHGDTNLAILTEALTNRHRSERNGDVSARDVGPDNIFALLGKTGTRTG